MQLQVVPDLHLKLWRSQSNITAEDDESWFRSEVRFFQRAKAKMATGMNKQNAE